MEASEIRCKYFDVIDSHPLIEDYVWLKGIPTPYSFSILKQVRLDAFGFEMVWNKYNNKDDEYGWTVDHCIPMSYCRLYKISKSKYRSFINLQPISFKVLNIFQSYLQMDIDGQIVNKQVFIEEDNQYQSVDYTSLINILKDDSLYFSQQYP